MCLTTVFEINEGEPSTAIFSGEKEFNPDGKKLNFQNQPNGDKYEVPFDEWITALPKVNKIKAHDGNHYEAGFHVWEEDSKSKNPNRRRVYYRQVVCKGEQNKEKIVIARQIYVPSDSDGWPPKPGEPSKKENLLDKAKKIIKAGNA